METRFHRCVCVCVCNYPIIFEDSEIPSLNSVNVLGLQISSSLSWRDHIVQIAKSASKKLGVLVSIGVCVCVCNYPIIFEDSEIPSLNSVNVLGLQISSSLSWRDHIVQIAKSASKKLGVLFRCKQ